LLGFFLSSRPFTRRSPMMRSRKRAAGGGAFFFAMLRLRTVIGWLGSGRRPPFPRAMLLHAPGGTQDRVRPYRGAGTLPVFRLRHASMSRRAAVGAYRTAHSAVANMPKPWREPNRR